MAHYRTLLLALTAAATVLTPPAALAVPEGVPEGSVAAIQPLPANLE
jgi:hypothetical protein